MGVARRFPVGSFEPRLVACDLDGTLLDERGLVRPTVRAAIAAVMAAGAHVVIATGRSTWTTGPAARALGLAGDHIVMNGGAYLSPVTGHVVWTRRLSGTITRDALAFASGLGAVPLLGFMDRHVCALRGSDLTGLPDFVRRSRLRRVTSLESVADRGPIRVFIPTPATQHTRAVADARDWFGERASIVFGDDSGFEVMSPRTNKGEALKAVADSMGLDRSQVAAMGDGPNDVEMLAYAGQSAALLPAPGAPPICGRLLREATVVLPSSAQDGAVEALRRFFPRLDTLHAVRAIAGPTVLRTEVDREPEPGKGQSAA